MDELMKLMEAGFTHNQALAILNSIATFGKPEIDLIDLLPFHSWFWYRLKQWRRAKKESKR